MNEPPEEGTPGLTEPRTSDPAPTLRRYERPHEAPATMTPVGAEAIIPFATLDDALAASSLTAGGQSLLRGLLRLGAPAIFAGGGTGIEYGSLLKTAARPDHLLDHVREASAYLHERAVDILVVPGMSGYPIGSMYSAISAIPAVLLKKQRMDGASLDETFPAGAFVIPSYTGEGDVVMSTDLDALQDIVDVLLLPQIERQREAGTLDLTVRIAGADDIIDKATMSQAVSESAMIVGRIAIARFVERHRARTGDARPVTERVEVVGWVTPLIKGYNRPHEHLMRQFGITPLAGLNVTSVQSDPPAIGIEGLGVVGFAPRG